MRLSKEARRLTLPPVSLQRLAAALMINHQRKEASDLLRWARGIHPTDFWIALLLGNVLGEPNEEMMKPVLLEEMIGCFRVAVALRPEAIIPHVNLGPALDTKYQLDDAITEYKKVIALDPKYAPAHFILGGALRERHQLDEANREYNKAIALDPNFATAHFNLGDTLLLEGNFAQAEASFQRCLELRAHFDPRCEDT